MIDFLSFYFGQCYAKLFRHTRLITQNPPQVFDYTTFNHQANSFYSIQYGMSEPIMSVREQVYSCFVQAIYPCIGVRVFTRTTPHQKQTGLFPETANSYPLKKYRGSMGLVKICKNRIFAGLVKK